MRKGKREEQEVFFATGPDGCVIGAMQHLQIALGVDEDDGLVTALYGLHNVELQIVGLARASRSGYEHVPFEITEGNKDRLFLLSTDCVKRRHPAKVSRATAARCRFTATLNSEHLVCAFGVPQKAVPQVLHLGSSRQLRERQQAKLARQVVADLTRSTEERDSKKRNSEPKPLNAGQEHPIRSRNRDGSDQSPPE